MKPSGDSADDSLRARLAAGTGLVLAAALYLWNAHQLPPLAGFDAAAHAGYVLTILEEARLPHPLEGWSTFHPPAYYLGAAAMWSLVEPLGPRAVNVGLRVVSAAGILAAGAVVFHLLRQRATAWELALVSACGVWFLPAAIFAASSEGNEGLVAGFVALCLPFALQLQRDPSRVGAAALAGLFAGLACATKYTGGLAVLACALPFARRDLPRGTGRALAACAAMAILVAGPVYLRNVALTGTPFPMTRHLEPMKSAEAAFALRPRQAGDYLGIPWQSLTRPYLFQWDEDRRALRLNRAMQNVWGLTYTSLWYDPFGRRVPVAYHRSDVRIDRMLVFGGLVPTALVLLGFAAAARDTWRSRARSAEAPLVLLMATGLGAFIAFTSQAPSLAAVKGTYLLPLLAPAGLLFARGTHCVAPRLRPWLVGLCLGVFALGAAVFTANLVFPPAPSPIGVWERIAEQLPDAYLGEAIERLHASP